MIEKSINELVNKVEAIPGWLAPEAAYFSACLLNYQRNINLSGNIIEIGVYHGKYLALLYQYLDKENERILGIDAFIGATETEPARKNVLNNIQNVCGDSQSLNILVDNSLDLTPSKLAGLIGSKNTRFISVDGGHTADVVCHDLYLSTALIKEGGVIAMDDIFNHSLPGVTEGLFKFVLQENNQSLAPFAHCYNKLFLTTPDHYTSYLKQSLQILEEMKHYPAYQRTKARISENQSLDFTPTLFGYEVLCFL